MHESRESEKGGPCDGVDTETSQSVQCWCDRAGRRPRRVRAWFRVPPLGFKTGLQIMKQALVLLLLIVAASLCGATPTAFARDATPTIRGYTTVVPLRKVSHEQVMNAVQSGATVPMWSYQITSPLDGMSYSGTMIGSSPFFNGLRTTSLPVVLVPLIIVMPDGGTFDPTVVDSCSLSNTITPLGQVQGSPVFQPAFFSMNGISLGTGLYSDEFQRANFYSANVSATGNSYHTVLSPITTIAAQTIHIPTNEGATYDIGCGGRLGVMDFATFDSIVTGTLIPALASQNVNPTSFPIFLMHNVVMADPGTSLDGNCCILGYHGAFGNPVQVYAPVDYDSSEVFVNPDISVLSHEVDETMDDPLGTNPTPAWGHVGQVLDGCQNNLEVGDPLTGVSFPSVRMPNNLTYHPQELAFFSWFFRQNPSIGAGGKYSDHGTFQTGAGPVCQ